MIVTMMLSILVLGDESIVGYQVDNKKMEALLLLFFIADVVDALVDFELEDGGALLSSRWIWRGWRRDAEP